jgi:ATP phosphoribosyltransferase regulatory subunit
MTNLLPKIPSGMRYYRGDEAAARRHIEDVGMQVLNGWSYEEISVPTVDYYSLFERGMGGAGAERSFRFTDLDGQMLALRPDVTSLVARAASTLLAKEERPLRLSYALPVYFQRHRSQSEWSREHMQIGAELIGLQGLAGEIEIALIIIEILDRLGLKSRCRITLNNVDLFNGIVENLNLDFDQRHAMRSLISHRDSMALESFLLKNGADPTECRIFAELIELSGDRSLIARARKAVTNARSVGALDDLDHLCDVIEELNLGSLCEVDFGDVAGLDYYTGTVFKVYVSGAANTVGSGGRYDDLISNFGPSEPAIGFVLESDVLTELLAQSFTGEPVAVLESERTADLATAFKRILDKRAREVKVRVSTGAGQ